MTKTKLEVANEKWAVNYAWNTYGVEAIKQKFVDRAGEPDRLFLFHNGYPLWIEFKREGEPLRPLQEHRVNELRGWGFKVETSDNKETSKEVIDRHARASGTKKLEAQTLPTPSRKVPTRQRMRRFMGRPGSR